MVSEEYHSSNGEILNERNQTERNERTQEERKRERQICLENPGVCFTKGYKNSTEPPSSANSKRHHNIILFLTREKIGT